MRKPSKNNLPNSPQARKMAAGNFMLEARRRLAAEAFRLLPEGAEVMRKMSEDPKVSAADRIAAAGAYKSIKRALRGQ